MIMLRKIRITFAVATIQGFRIGIPGMALQVAGGYYFIKYILKNKVVKK